MVETSYLYAPALRLKTGELKGISQIRDNIKNHIRPHFIIPPSKERDGSNFELFGDLESRPEAGVTLGQYWNGRSALLNPRFIYKEFGEDKTVSWLPALFDSARGAGVDAIPVATILDLEGNRFEGLVKTVNVSGNVKISIVVKADDLVSEDLNSRLLRQLSRINVEPSECCLLLDFTGAHFGNPDDTATIIEGAYEDVQAVGTWESIAFQGTSFPEVNPADHKSSVMVPRNEWLAWKLAVSLSPNTPNSFVFGDYAADSSKMHTGKGGVAAIRHLRYATSDFWLVARAAATGKDKARMQWVAENIVESDHFAGQEFSPAGERIYRMAKENGGPGTAAIWRQINTTQHLTRAVIDNARLRGIAIEEPAAIPSSEQLVLPDV